MPAKNRRESLELDTGIPLSVANLNGQGACKRGLVALAAGGAPFGCGHQWLVIWEKRTSWRSERFFGRSESFLSGKAVVEGDTCTVSLEIGKARLLLQEDGRELISPFATGATPTNRPLA
jgi:hypothetical protein